MSKMGKVEQAQLPIIQKIIDNEKWLLSEQLNFDCGENHPILIDRVTQIILISGAEIRKMAENSLNNY